MRVTWFGHSAFRLEFGDKTVLIDPFLTGNPSFGGDVAAATAGTTHILLTHGHSDHIGDTVEIAGRTGATLVANFEVCMWLGGKGVASSQPMNTGGSLDLGGFTVSMVRADHSATVIEDGAFVPMGNPNGIVVEAPGEPTVYHMGDTDLFGDMALVQEFFAPEIVMVPIGDRFTMGPKRAAAAIRRFFKPEAVIPCHYGTFPIIAPNADAFVAAMEGSGVQVVIPQIGTGIRFDRQS